MALRQRFHYDESDQKVVIESCEDVEVVLRTNAALRSAGDRGYTPSKEWRRIASIPEIVVHMWMMEGINIYRPEDWPKVAARLASPEWAFLRTAPGDPRSRPLREYFRGSTASPRALARWKERAAG